jgi:type II secretory pathway pseudopilin PulG
MQLSGQAKRCARTEQGYAMAALLVGMSVMAVLMTVAMPVWKQMVQREKEEELVFRGQQYIRAIALFQRRTGPALPPNVDLLVSQHFLRRKYKDPITNDDFLLIPASIPAGTQLQAQAQQNSLQTLGRGATSSGAGGNLAGGSSGAANSTSAANSGSASGARSGTGANGGGTTNAGYIVQGGPLGTNVPGGVTGVVSKSSDTSIRIFNGRNHYNEWEFRFIAPAPPPPPANGNGATGGRGGGPQRGNTPDFGGGIGAGRGNGRARDGGPGGGFGPDGRGAPTGGRGGQPSTGQPGRGAAVPALPGRPR